MKAILFDDFEVEIDPRIWEIGPSWRKGRAKDGYLIKFLHKRLRGLENPVVLDIGACAGAFSLLAKFHPDAFFYAYEPNPRAFEFLLENIRLNDLGMRIGTMPFALSNKDGRATLLVPPQQNRAGSSTIGPHPHSDIWDKVTVETRRLDRFSWPDGIDLIKLDVEGAEFLVLKGGRHTIKKYKPGILLEYFEPNTRRFGYKPDAIKKLLQSWGYKNFQPVEGEGKCYDLWATA